VWPVYRHHYYRFYGQIVKSSPRVSRIYLGLSIFVLVFQTFIFLSVCNGMTDMADDVFLFSTGDLFNFIDFAVSPNYISLRYKPEDRGFDS
jgi:hypothetical protein